MIRLLRMPIKKKPAIAPAPAEMDNKVSVGWLAEEYRYDNARENDE